MKKKERKNTDFWVPASYFLAGVANVLLVLCFVSSYVGYPLRVYGYSLSWLQLSLGQMSRLTSMLLCAWTGLLLRRAHVFANPTRCVQLLLFLAMCWGMWTFGKSLLEEGWMHVRYGEMMLACILFGYLLPLSSVKQHNTVELAVMSVAFAVLYAVSELLTEYRWVRIIPLLGFLYMTTLLAFTETARKIVQPRWVQIVVVVFSVTYILILLWLLFTNSWWRIIRILQLLTQPIVVLLIFQLIQKKKKDG